MKGGSRRRRGSPIPPGEGERRALSGYVPQWELAARLIHQSLADGTLRWIGLADPGAGIFDDVLLGFEGRIAGYQVKSTKKPETVRLRTLLLGGADLWSSVVGSWRQLKSQYPDCAIELAYATDNFLDNEDDLTAGAGVSSAALQRAQEHYRKTWTLEQWRTSAFGSFVAELLKASGLTEAEFELLWSGFSLITGGTSRLRGLSAGTTQAANRQATLFALLPKLVAASDEKRRLTRDDLLRELGWRDPFGLRHQHVFPVDSLSQSNPKSEGDVRAVVETTKSGYISLLGAPGSGKSTLLQTGLIGIPGTAFLRYLAFVPDEGHGLGRAEAIDFLQDLVTQLKRQGLGSNEVTGDQLPELRLQFETLLCEAGERFANRGTRTVIVVDGLDHIPREEQPDHSLLRVLPLPHAVPEGVLFLLGSQKLDLAGIPPSVRDQAGESRRRVDIAPLARDAVHRIANASRLSEDVDRDDLYDRSEGHPLTVRYLIERLLAISSDDERKNWLSEGPGFGGNSEAFYERAWREVADDRNARRALSYLALVEGHLDPVQLDELVGRTATDQTARAALHLLKRDRKGRWSIFHNSFRQFLLEKFSYRFGRRDDAELQRRYCDLAKVAARVGGDDPQRWLQLRYLARAEDHDAVLGLATPKRFRSQFINQRNPNDIQVDIRFSFTAARVRRNVAKLFELVLCRHEIEMRADAIPAEKLIDAYIDIGDLDAARGVIDAGYSGIPIDAPYKVVDALLEVNRLEDARQLFERSEPIEKLLGAEPVSLHHRDDAMLDWAGRALIFRDVAQFNSALSHLQLPDGAFGRDPPDALENYKLRLRQVAARSVLGSNPSTDLGVLCKSLELNFEAESPTLSVIAAEFAYSLNQRSLAAQRLTVAAQSVRSIARHLRIRAAGLSLALHDMELSRNFFRGLPPPSLISQNSSAGERMIGATLAVFEFAYLEQRLDERKASRTYPTNLHGPYQRAVESAGRLLGRGRSGKVEDASSVWQCLRDLLVVAAHGSGDGKGWDSQRWELNYALPTVAELVLIAAKAHGTDALMHTITNIEEMMGVNPGHLGLPSFRRAFAAAAYASEHDTGKALRRMPPPPTIEEHTTPDEYAAEMCELAAVLARVGDAKGGHRTLTTMYKNALGISRPARKDGQYEMWRMILENANRVDPINREERVREYAKLLVGLVNTEGQGAAHRMVEAVMREAALGRPQLAGACFNAFDQAGIGTWAKLLTATLRGLIVRRSDLADAASALFVHLILPVMDELDDDFFPELLRAASSPQRVLNDVVASIEMDAHAALRFPLLEQLAGLAKSHGLVFPLEALERWRPLPDKPMRRSSDTVQDPFEGTKTLEAFTRILESSGKESDNYYAARALERLAETTSYEEVRRFADDPQIRTSQRGMLAIARAAMRSGARDDAERYADGLRHLVEKDSSWGSWQSGAKMRLHTFLVELEGEAARNLAFEAFAHDLSRGREWSASLIPDLAEVFSIFEVKPNWPHYFSVLLELLKEFRDFQVGSDLVIPLSRPEKEETLLSNIMISAVELMTSDMCAQVRYAAIDLQSHGETVSNEIVATLINMLLDKGGEFALEGTRIAWEGRFSAAVEGVVRANIVSLIESDDLAVMRFGMLFAASLNVAVSPTAQSMPAFYDLELPWIEGAETFEPPAGFSPTGRGLWTDDSLSWTWPLEKALKLVREATDIPIQVLRFRAAEFMRKAGGRDLFGPEAADKQDHRLRRLDLKMMYRRLPVIAAFRAARQIGAELVRAGKLSVRDVHWLLNESGGSNPYFPSIRPTRRPESILSPSLPINAWTRELEAWVGEDASLPNWPEHTAGVVLGAVHEFHLTSIREEASEGFLFVHGPDRSDGSELGRALFRLPRAVSGSSIIPLEDVPSESGLVVIMPDKAATFPDLAISLCPRVAFNAGLHPDPSNPLNYLDGNGEVAARAIWWRDGGLRRRDIDRSVHGEGFIAVISPSVWPRIQRQIRQRVAIRRWRSVNFGEEDRVTEKQLSWTLHH